MTYLYDGSLLIKDGPNIDAFGRLRTSEPYVLFDSQLQNDKAPLLWSESVSGTNASSVHYPNESAVYMTVGTTQGEKVIRQSRIYTRYQPGKSHMIMMTGILGVKKSGVRQRIGYFDDTSGLFFEQDGVNLKVVRRSYTTGTPNNVAVTQSSWNLDKMDGSGPSGVSIDTSKTQIFFIDLEWLGVGRVRFGFVINGKVIYCHEMNHANNMTEVYISHANLPCRYEIENIQTSSSSTTMKQICSTVMSEGGYNPRGYLRHEGITTPKTVNTTLVPVMSLRPKASYKGTWFEPTSCEMINTSNSFVYYQVIISPTLIGANWRDTTSSSFIEVDTSATSVSGGTVVAGGFLNTRDLQALLVSDNIPVIGTNLDGSRDTLCLAMQTISGTASILSGVNWKEVR